MFQRFHIVLIIFFSTCKFAATFPVAIYLVNMSFFETILYTNIGGILGVLSFAMISKGIIHLVKIPFFNRTDRNKRPKKVFTRRNRRFVQLKKKYGLAGIVILTPLLLSIPIGTFLVTKYYGHHKRSYLYLILGQIAWSLIYTYFYAELKVVL